MPLRDKLVKNERNKAHYRILFIIRMYTKCIKYTSDNTDDTETTKN